MNKHVFKKAVVLLSGGVDSSVTAAIAKAEGYEIYALSFDYGQRHRLEIESARKVAENLSAKKHLIIRFDLREIGGSALTADIAVPKRNIDSAVNSGYSPFQQKLESQPLSSELIPATYVPARNTIFLSFALAWAEVLEAQDIFIGANAIDYSGYPDCRPQYLKAFEDMANLATKASAEGIFRFRINAPLLYMTKAEIIKKGIEVGIDYSITWSCYDPQNSQISYNDTEPAPCGRCESCLFRAKGFRDAGIADPLLKQA
jgi:7-cyano-7-deazaguanine synthase